MEMSQRRVSPAQVSLSDHVAEELSRYAEAHGVHVDVLLDAIVLEWLATNTDESCK